MMDIRYFIDGPVAGTIDLRRSEPRKTGVIPVVDLEPSEDETVYSSIGWVVLQDRKEGHLRQATARVFSCSDEPFEIRPEHNAAIRELLQDHDEAWEPYHSIREAPFIEPEGNP